ncbi:MAG: quinol:electron acceptor oxidoreductase subunit ActD [Akkermansia sp.]
MKKPVISGWVLSFGSEKALLQAVRVLVKEENLRWEVCAPYPCAAVRLANRHAGKAVGAGVRLWAAAGGVCGFLAVALWLYWTQFCADPLVTQGRVQGWDSWPAYVPPLFEGTLLGAGLLTAAGFLKGAVLPGGTTGRSSVISSGRMNTGTVISFCWKAAVKIVPPLLPGTASGRERIHP